MPRLDLTWADLRQELGEWERSVSHGMAALHTHPDPNPLPAALPEPWCCAAVKPVCSVTHPCGTKCSRCQR